MISTRKPAMMPAARVLTVLALTALQACASFYFKAAEPPPQAVRYAVESWPYHELWNGIVFNGAKIGFAHTRLVRSAQSPERYEILSEASLLLRFLGFEKKIQMRSRDIVGHDLGLDRFEAQHTIDGNETRLRGTVSEGRLRVEVENAGRTTLREFALEGRVIPVSALLFYPVLHGLEVGREHRYQAFDSETVEVAPVLQRVTAYERSELFAGETYKVVTRLLNQETTSWIDRQGRPVFELALHGVLISALEDEISARRYLTTAALNKFDVLLDLSLVQADRRIPDPRALKRLNLRVEGAVGPLASGGMQLCVPDDAAWRCELDVVRRAQAADASRFLNASVAIPYNDPQIVSLARQIAAGENDPAIQVERILRWLAANIRKSPADAFSALDVLRTRKAECQGHAYLYTALARALGIPTRVANGLVYSEPHGGFLYHTWAESVLDGQWVPVDPTFGQTAADASHLRIAIGEEPADLTVLADWIGQVSVRVLDYSH